MHPETHLIWSKSLHWERYFRPQSISEALTLLEEFKGEARIIAGGTDLIPQIRNREKESRVLVDITHIAGLKEIKLEKGLIKIGALVTHSQIVDSSFIEEKALALKEGAQRLGSPQIRDLGTVVGNVVSGLPSADTTIPLLALNGTVKVMNHQGEKFIPLTEFFIDTGVTAVDPTREIVTEISFPPLSGEEASISLRLARRKALALPILTVSIVLSADLKKKKFQYGRIALGPVAPVPFRAKEAENLFASATIYDKTIKKIAQKAAEESNPRDSTLRGSGEYRKEMVANLVERGIRKGIERLEVKHA